jgi:tripartite-type tricarboxylate transporter receptor subunit TctC
VAAGEILRAVWGGSLRLLAVLDEQRVPEFPAVPTLLDPGFGWAANPWLGFGGPRGLPAPVATRYRAAAEAAMATEGFRKAMADPAILPKQLWPEETAAMMRESLAENERVARLIHIDRFTPQLC